jgi:hypothetical protein
MTTASDLGATRERIARGTLLALVVVPLGIAAWVILWRVNFGASLVGLAIAWGAVALYRLGSGGAISRPGAIRVSIVAIGSTLLAALAGLVSDVLPIYSRGVSGNWFQALFTADFWTAFQRSQDRPGGLADEFPWIVLGIGLCVLGCFVLLRRSFRKKAPPRPSS